MGLFDWWSSEDGDDMSDDEVEAVATVDTDPPATNSDCSGNEPDDDD